jgi:hypothetical protein
MSRFPRGMYVAMHFAAAAQVLLLFEMQWSGNSVQWSAKTRSGVFTVH